MSTDKELVELAAKAAGMKPSGLWLRNGMECEGPNSTESLGDFFVWNPLTDDGDALRLAVKLGFRLDQDWFRPQGGYDPNQGRARALTTYSLEQTGSFDFRPLWVKEEFKGDPYAATRRAIVRAAAEIGRTL